MKKKVVIVGGGFAGSHVAKSLEKYFDVFLIDTKDYFEFTPGVLRAIVEPLHIRNIQALHNHYLKWAKVIEGGVKKIDRKFVYVNGKRFRYDYLVIASGSSYEAAFKEQRVVTAARAAHLRDYYDVLCKSKKVLIVGGGLVGVELTGEILDKYEDKEITIVHSGERLIARNNRKATSYAADCLRRKGVKILYRQRMIDKKGRFCIMESGKKVEADLVFLCTGIKPNFEFMKGEFRKFLNNNGQIEVNEFLQLRGMDNVFAIGDITGIEEEKTAQNAERQAEVIVHNICNIERRIELCKYRAKVTPLVISLGKYNGILTKGDFVLTGRIPALMKAWIERWEMYKKRKVS